MTTYYVNNLAAAGGNGTTSALTGANCAWDTVADVNGASFNAGDSILFARGCTWREQLTVPSSGSAGSVITFGAYGDGADPIINGSDIIATWTVKANEETAGVFSTGFEDEVDAFTTDWTSKTTESGNTVTLVSTPTKNGVKAMAGTFDGVNDSQDCYVSKTLPSSYSDIYARCYFRYNAAFGMNTAGNGIIPFGFTTGGAPYAYLRFLESSGAYKIMGIGPGGTAVGAGVALSADTWYYLELHYVKSATVGGIEFWVNGVSGGSNFTLNAQWTMNGVWAGGRVYAANQEPKAGSIIYYDDIVVSQTAIGAAAVGTNSLFGLNTWGATCTTEPNIVFFDGTRGTKVANLAAVDSERDWFWASNVLYCYSTTDPDTAYTSPGIESGSRTACVYLDSKDYVTVENLELKHANLDGVRLATAGNNLTVNACDINNNYAWGVNAYCTSQNENGVISNSEISYNGGSGISLNRSKNWTITGNSVHHNCQLTDNETYHAYSAGIKLNPQVTCLGNIIEHNTIYSNGVGLAVSEGLGIWIDTNGAGNIVRYNLIYSNNYLGIKNERTSSTQIYYNIIHSTTYPNSTSGSGAGLYITGDNDGDGGPANSNLVYNNVLYGNYWGIIVYGDDTSENCCSGNLVKNNISTGSTVSELFAWGGGQNDGTHGTGNVYTYNCFGAEKANFVNWGGSNKSTYDAWETAYGATTSSIEADPAFVSTVTPDFHLLSTSPCINSGTDVGLTTDYAGKGIIGTPDIGAYEFQVYGSSLTQGMGLTFKED
jgi:hypothetical protein